MKIVSGFLFVIVTGLSAMFYSMSSSDIEDLIICSSHNKSHYIPQAVCKTYLFQYRGTVEDIQALESRAGISFIFGLDDEADKIALFDFLLAKKININAISPIDGFTPLHAAVLERDSALVEKLLNSGADKTIISPSINSTPLALAKQLQEKGEADYTKIIELFK